MSRRKRFLFGLSVPLLLVTLGACRQDPPPNPLNFDTDPGILRGRWEGSGVSDHYYAAAFSPGGALFGAGTQEGYKVWETASGNVRLTLPTERPETAVFNPDGSLMVFRDALTVRLLAADTGEVLAELAADTLYGDTPVFSPDGSWLLITQDEKTRLLRVKRTATGLELVPGPFLSAKPPDISYSAAFNSESTLALVSDSTGVTLWRVADGTLIRRYSTGYEYPGVTFGPDDSVFLGGTNHIRQLAVTGELLREFTARDAEDVFGYFPVVSPDGRYLLSYGYGLIFWNAETGEQLADLTRTPLSANFNEPFDVSFSGDGNKLYAASSNGAVDVRDLSSGDEAIGQARNLFRTESFTVALDLTASYLDTSRYAIRGTFGFGDEPAKALSGEVCVPEGLEPQRTAQITTRTTIQIAAQLTAQTSPAECDVNFTVGDAAAPEWRGSGSTPFGTLPITLFEVSRGQNVYRFEVRPRQ